MSQKILVTICNYNHSKYLAQSIESIQNQSYSNLDICIVDDGSSDIDVVREIVKQKSNDDRIRFIELDKNHGKWFALNKAIETTDAVLCTSHDADDISLRQRIELQYHVMTSTNTLHNLCGFFHCWNEEDVKQHIGYKVDPNNLAVINPEETRKMVLAGFQHPGINHFYTGNVETAGVSAMFAKDIYNLGIRFNPPSVGLRTLLSEDSDFNFRVTSLLGSTSVLAEQLYLYRRNTSTNEELI